MEQVKPKSITREDIIDAIMRMQERGEFPNTISMNPKQYCKLRSFPNYSEEFLYGCQIVNYEMGSIEGLIIQVIPGLDDKSIYVSKKNLTENNLKWG